MLLALFKSNSVRRYLVLLMGAILVVCVAVVLARQTFQGTPVERVTIELQASGFVPAAVTLSEGGTVTFVNMTSLPFWPASDPHPTHTIYPAFDPQRPIEAGGSWSFTFTRAGVWKYHDHLAPAHTGTITVLNKEGKTGLADCSSKGLSIDRKQQCWEDAFLSAIGKGGLPAAFKLLSSLYVSDPDFPSRCHGYTHIIGEAAYREFAKKGKAELAPETSYCGYGFYHGFMETLLSTTGDVGQAQALCAYADKTLGGDAKGACYHGIGHGFVDGSDPRTRNNPQAMIAQGLTVCEQVGENDYFTNRCASGVFNSLAIFFNDSIAAGTAPSQLAEDPYFVCKTQTKEYFKKPCYEEMNTTILTLVDFNLPQAFAYAKAVPDTFYGAASLEALPGYAFSVHEERYTIEHTVALCQTLSGVFRTACIRGFAAGFIEFGAPGKEYEKSLAFCQSNLLAASEQTICLNRAIEYLRLVYSKEKFAQMCNVALAKNYQDHYCTTP